MNLLSFNTASKCVEQRNDILRNFDLYNDDPRSHTLPPALNASDVLLWRPDIFASATNKSDDMVGAHCPIQFHGPQLWLMGGDATSCSTWQWVAESVENDTTKGGFEVSGTLSFVGLLVYPVKDEIAAVVIAKDSKQGFFWYISLLDIDGTVPDKFCASILAAYMFLDLPFVSADIMHLKRHEQRQLARHGQHVPEVRTVTLRVNSAASQSDGRHIEYHHCWMVKGHWRRLHTPRRRDGAEVTYVMPHTKGDPSLPMMPPRDTVFMVTR